MKWGSGGKRNFTGCKVKWSRDKWSALLFYKGK